MPTHFSRAQIWLHWAIFALFASQCIFHEPIVAAWSRVEQGLPAIFDPLVLAHVIGGLIIFALAAWRIALRPTRSAPALPPNEPTPQKFAAHTTHLGLYGLMVLMPLPGALAWSAGNNTAPQAHDAMKPLLIRLLCTACRGRRVSEICSETQRLSAHHPHGVSSKQDVTYRRDAQPNSNGRR